MTKFSSIEIAPDPGAKPGADNNEKVQATIDSQGSAAFTSVAVSGASTLAAITGDTLVLDAAIDTKFTLSGSQNPRVVFDPTTGDTYWLDIDTGLRIRNATDGRVEMHFKGNGDVVIGTDSAIATNATGGFLIIPTMAGDASGTPANAASGAVLAYDTTNDELKIYTGGAWRVIGSTAQ